MDFQAIVLQTYIVIDSICTVLLFPCSFLQYVYTYWQTARYYVVYKGVTDRLGYPCRQLHVPASTVHRCRRLSTTKRARHERRGDEVNLINKNNKSMNAHLSPTGYGRDMLLGVA